MANLTAELKSPEAAIKAALPEHSSHTAGEKAIRKARLEAQVDQDGAHKFLANLTERIDPKTTQAALDRNIGMTYDAAGNKILTARESSIYDRARQYGKLNWAVGEGQYDGLADPNDQREIRDQVDTALSHIPLLKNILDGIGPPGNPARDAYLEAIVKDPSFALQVRKLHNENSKTTVEEFDIPELQSNYEAKKQNASEKETHFKDLEMQALVIAEQLKQNKGSDLRHLTAHLKVTSLDRATTDIKTFRIAHPTDAETVDKYIAFRNQNIVLDLKLNAAKASGATPAEIKAIHDERSLLIQKAKSGKYEDPSKFNAEQTTFLINMDTFTREELISNQSAIEPQVKQAKEESTLATKERMEADTKLKIAKHKRTVAEEKFADSFDGVFGKAAIAYVGEELKASEAAKAKVIKELKDADVEAHKDELLNMLGGRWNANTRGVFGREISRLNGRAVRNDYAILVNQGPGVLIDRLIQDNPVLRLLSNEEKMALRNKPELKNQFSATLLLKRVEAGTLPTNEVRRIIGTDWGETALADAIKKNKSASDMIETLRKEGKIHGSIGEWLSRHSDRNLVTMFLALIAGIGSSIFIGGATGIPGLAALAAGGHGGTAGVVGGTSGLAAFGINR